MEDENTSFYNFTYFNLEYLKYCAKIMIENSNSLYLNNQIQPSQIWIVHYDEYLNPIKSQVTMKFAETMIYSQIFKFTSDSNNRKINLLTILNNSMNEILNEENIIGKDLSIEISKNLDEISRTSFYLLIILLIIITASFAVSIPITFLTKRQIEKNLLSIVEVNQKDIKQRLRELKEYYYDIINSSESVHNININQEEVIYQGLEERKMNSRMNDLSTSNQLNNFEQKENEIDEKNDEFEGDEEEEEKALEFRGKRQKFQKFHRNYFWFIIQMICILIILVGLSLMIYFLIENYITTIADFQDHFQLVSMTYYNSFLYLIISATLFSNDINSRIAGEPLTFYLQDFRAKMLSVESSFENSFYRISVSQNYKEVFNNYMFNYLCNIMEGKLKEECLDLQLGNLLKGFRLANNQIIDSIYYHISYFLKNSSYKFLNVKAYCQIEFITLTYFRLLYYNLSKNSNEEIFALINSEKTFILLVLIFTLCIGLILFISWLIYSIKIKKELSQSRELIKLIPNTIIESNIKLREFISSIL